MGRTTHYSSIDRLLASYRGLAHCAPDQIRCPLYIYAGSDDQRITKPLLEKQEEIDAQGITLRIFDHLDHAQEISEINVVYPSAEIFLRKTSQE
ncbi:hypothetical protein KDW_63630 [Dictyobacter vulcani]|uniref:Serine aminopeptidase S33 domain-containing protein n=1 Tax=Dictyobacter vulcani TaxID=2607529 RepID=A0A5J4L0A9_9CHLR|nr:hypothetical protein [Dictyobacter vulcani]GER92201.1 hypothetical protein KDW_63630 [Dictyobacter vulcani]